MKTLALVVALLSLITAGCQGHKRVTEGRSTSDLGYQIPENNLKEVRS